MNGNEEKAAEKGERAVFIKQRKERYEVKSLFPL